MLMRTCDNFITDDPHVAALRQIDSVTQGLLTWQLASGDVAKERLYLID